MRRKGFTLIEMMTVVAILGVMAAIAGTAIMDIIRVGVVNGGANTTSRMLANARLRALSMRCGVFAQINGPSYAPAMPAVGQPVRKNAVFVVLKGDCNSPNMFFEGDGAGPLPDDRVLAEFNIDARLQVVMPTTLIPGGKMTSESVIVGWGGNPSNPAVLMVDAGAGPTPTGAPPLDIQFVAASGGTSSRHTFVPINGLPYND